MAALTSQQITDSFEQLLHVDRDGGGNGATLVSVKDGDNGTTFALQISTAGIKSTGTLVVDGISTLTGAVTTGAGLVVTTSLTVGTTLGVTGVATFSNNILIANGKYIGQAAGPQVLFDDTNDYLKITGANNVYFNPGTSSNISLGMDAGNVGTIAGTNSLSIGDSAGKSLTTGSSNVLVGNSSGTVIANGTKNTCVGYSTGAKIVAGSSNTHLGALSGQYSTGDRNVSIGSDAGLGVSGSTTASDNTLTGYQAGKAVTTGGKNCLFGSNAGLSITTGVNNILIGYASGDNLTTGDANIIIGYDINASAVGVDNELNIGDAIKGDLATGNIAITGNIVSGSATLSAVGPTDDYDVDAINVLFIDTNANNVTIGGFTNGIAGQVLHIVVKDATGNTVLEHAEGTGNQDLYLIKGADETLTAEYGGWIFVCDGIHWYQCNPAIHV